MSLWSSQGLLHTEGPERCHMCLQVLHHPALVPVGGPDTCSVLYMVHTDRPTTAHTAVLSFLGVLCFAAMRRGLVCWVEEGKASL